MCEPIKQACQQAPQQDSDYVQKVAFRFHWETSLAKLTHPLQKLKISADTINNNAPAVQALLEEGASLLKQDDNKRLPIDYLHLPNEPTNQAQQPIIDIISSIMHYSTHLKKFDYFVQSSNKLKIQLNQAVKHCNYSIVNAFVNSLNDISLSCFNVSHLKEAKRMANEASQPNNDAENQALNDIKDLLDRQITAYENGQACSLTEQIAQRLT